MLTYFGHSCFGLELAGSHLLFDPFITPNDLAVGKVDVEAIPADYILISHGHIDHMFDAKAIAGTTGASVISSFEIVSWFEKQGIDRTIRMNLGGRVSLPFGSVKYVAAVHSSSLPDGSYAGTAGGFVLESAGLKLYFAGDTALSMDMQLIARNKPVDYAFLPIGDTLTMGVEDAIEAAKMVKCAKVIGMHYNTFPDISIDKAAAKDQFAKAGIQLLLPDIGQRTELKHG